AVRSSPETDTAPRIGGGCTRGNYRSADRQLSWRRRGHDPSHAPRPQLVPPAPRPSNLRRESNAFPCATSRPRSRMTEHSALRGASPRRECPGDRTGSHRVARSSSIFHPLLEPSSSTIRTPYLLLMLKPERLRALKEC